MAGCNQNINFPSLLTNKDKLLSDCRHTELNSIGDVIKINNECTMFVRTDNKMKKKSMSLFIC